MQLMHCRKSRHFDTLNDDDDDNDYADEDDNYGV